MTIKMSSVDAASFLNISLQGIHKSLKTRALFFEKSQNRVFFGHETAKGLFGIKFQSRIVTFQIVKGGTGKSTLVHSIAIRANLYGARVLCIDLDQQGNLTQAFQVSPEQHPCMLDVLSDGADLKDSIVNVSPGLDLIGSHIENALLDNTIMLKRLPLDRVYRDRFAQFKENYDLILIDCPPALGQSVAAAALASDLIVAPVAPEKFCLSGLKITTSEIGNLENTYQTKIPIKIILNKYDNRTTLSHDVLASLVKHPIYGEMLFKSYIRISQEFPNTIANEQSIFETLKNTTAKEDIDIFTRELLRINQDENQESLKEELSLTA